MLDAARRVFAERGFDGGGVLEIAAGCGCTEPVLYRHFASKQALFAAVLTDLSELVGKRVDEVISRHDDPLEALLSVVKDLADDELMNDAIRLRMLAVSLADDPTIRDALARSVTEMLDRIEALLRHASALGTLRPDIDPSEAAWLWFGFVLSRGYRASLFDDARTGAVTTAETLIRLLESPKEIR